MEHKHEEGLREQYNNEVKGLVQKAGDLLRSPYGLWFLGGFTFADSALGLPVTMDPFLVAYIVANRKKAWWGFLIVVCASVLGGVFAYFFTSYIFREVLVFLSPEQHHMIGIVSHKINKNPFLFTLLVSFSPIPYTIAAVTAGALKVNVLAFIVGSFLGRFVRYGMIAYPTYLFGEKAVAAANRNRLLVVAISAVLLLLYIAAIIKHF